MNQLIFLKIPKIIVTMTRGQKKMLQCYSINIQAIFTYQARQFLV